MKKLFKKLIIIVFLALASVLSIYKFELDTLAIKKIEPTFRRFASKIE